MRYAPYEVLVLLLIGRAHVVPFHGWCAEAGLPAGERSACVDTDVPEDGGRVLEDIAEGIEVDAGLVEFSFCLVEVLKCLLALLAASLDGPGKASHGENQGGGGDKVTATRQQEAATKFFATTDGSGRYSLLIPPGKYDVSTPNGNTTKTVYDVIVQEPSQSVDITVLAGSTQGCSRGRWKPQGLGGMDVPIR